MAREVWEVYRRMVVMDQYGTWERQPYEVLVWKCDGKVVTATPQKPKPGFAAGLFTVKLNGQVVTPLDAFISKLTTLNLTLEDVERACHI